MNQSFKEKLYTKCQSIVNAKIKDAQDSITEAQNSANNETKSSAGDKYETGRAMMHLEKEKHARRLSEALQLKQALGQIKLTTTPTEVIQLGSLVETDQGLFFLAVSLGKIVIEQTPVFVISLASPIGKGLYQLQKKETFKFRNKTYRILSFI